MSPDSGGTKDSCNPNKVGYSRLMDAVGKKSGFGWLKREQAELPRLGSQNGTDPSLHRENHQSLDGLRSENQMMGEGKCWRIVFYLLSHLPPQFLAL